MFGTTDNTYNDIRERSLMQWLSEMEVHDDVAVRCGVRLAREYMEYLKEENIKLKRECDLKDKYLKKMSKRG
ncbi:MAG: hypothetical protein PUG71_08045 [bacterium]|nr:hypothetical protein [bacterium]